MQKNEFLLMNNIIYQIYSIDDFTTMKETFLNLIRIILPNTCASILMSDLNSHTPTLCNPLCIPASFTELEQKYIMLQNDDTTRWIMFSKQGMVIRESDLIAEAELVRTSFYQKCYVPFGLHYSAQLYLVHKEIFLGVVTLYRSKSQGNFTDEELNTLKLFGDHLSLRFYKEFFTQNESQKSEHYCSPHFISEYHLTNREVEVLELIFQELDNEKIANTLCISNFTLKKHIQNLYTKLGVSSRWDLLRFRN